MSAVGVDLSEAILKLARARFAAERLPNKIEFHQTDTRNLSNENFDAATFKTGRAFFLLVDAVREKDEAVFEENVAAWTRHAEFKNVLKFSLKC